MRSTFQRAKWLLALTPGIALLATACADDVVAPRDLVRPGVPNSSVIASDSIPNSYIVVLADTVTQDIDRVADRVIAAVGGKKRHVLAPVVKGFSLENLPAIAVKALAQDPSVKYIEPNRVLYPGAVQFLPLDGGTFQFSSYWALDRIDEFGAPIFDGQYQYDFDGAGSNVYIVDSGVRGGHSQFAGRIGNGVCKVSNSFGCSPTIDALGHGTSVASLAAGSTYGVARQAIIHPVRIDDGNMGASCDDIVDGLNWVALNHGAQSVANLSYGGIPNCFSVRDALDALVAFNVVAVKSAGNNNVDAFQDRANRSAGSIIVGATDRLDSRAVFNAVEASNFGPTLSLFAPGVALRAAGNASNTDSVFFAGTSGAAPITAGVAAIVRQHYPSASVATIKSLIINAASNVDIGNDNTSPQRLLFSRVP